MIVGGKERREFSGWGGGVGENCNGCSGLLHRCHLTGVSISERLIRCPLARVPFWDFTLRGM